MLGNEVVDDRALPCAICTGDADYYHIAMWVITIDSVAGTETFTLFLQKLYRLSVFFCVHLKNTRQPLAKVSHTFSPAPSVPVMPMTVMLLADLQFRMTSSLPFGVAHEEWARDED